MIQRGPRKATTLRITYATVVESEIPEEMVSTGKCKM